MEDANYFSHHSYLYHQRDTDYCSALSGQGMFVVGLVGWSQMVKRDCVCIYVGGWLGHQKRFKNQGKVEMKIE